MTSGKDVKMKLELKSEHFLNMNITHAFVDNLSLNYKKLMKEIGHISTAKSPAPLKNQPLATKSPSSALSSQQLKYPNNGVRFCSVYSVIFFVDRFHGRESCVSSLLHRKRDWFAHWILHRSQAPDSITIWLLTSCSRSAIFTIIIIIVLVIILDDHDGVVWSNWPH